MRKKSLAALICISMLICSCNTKNTRTEATKAASDETVVTTKGDSSLKEKTSEKTSADTKTTEASSKTFESSSEQESTSENSTDKSSETTSEAASNEPVTEPPTEEKTNPYSYDYSKDKTKPLLVNLTRDIYLEKGKPFIPGKYISYIDDMDKNPTLIYTGSVNINTNGTYPITFKIFDAAGNTTTADATVYVYEKSSGSGTDVGPVDPPKRTQYADAVAKYSGTNASVGIDISRWQGTVDFNAVKNTGCEYVIMRMCTYVDDEIGKDSRFDYNFKNAKAVGMKVGVYIYTECRTVEEARENAKWIIKTLNGEKLDFPITFDWEDWGNLQDYHITISELNAMFDAFASTLEDAGYEAMLYSSRYYLQILWENPKNRALWMAAYSSSPNYDKPFMLWQFCDNGVIDGINDASVDFNVWYH